MPTEQNFDERQDQILDHLSRAIAAEDLIEIGRYSAKLQKFWAVAVVRMGRSEVASLNRVLESLAATAYEKIHAEYMGPGVDHWYAVWKAMSHIGGLILDMDDAQLLVAEAAKVDRISHAETILGILSSEGTTSRCEILEVVRSDEPGISSQAFQNKLTLLMKAGWVIRPARAAYRATPLGSRLGRFLVERERTGSQKADDRTQDDATPQQRAHARALEIILGTERHQQAWGTTPQDRPATRVDSAPDWLTGGVRGTAPPAPPDDGEGAGMTTVGAGS
jgi:hypothetical protein